MAEDGLEVEVDAEMEEKKTFHPKRWRSIRIGYLTFFIESFGFIIYAPSIWPYLKQLEPSASERLLGWVVGCASFTAIVSIITLSALFHHLKRRRKEMILATLLVALSSCVLYALAEDVPTNRGYYIIATRLILGLGTGRLPLLRDHVITSTTLEERTGVMGLVSGIQGLGYLLGPGLAAALALIGYPGFVHEKGLRLNLYTMPSVVYAILLCFNIIIVCWLFKEGHVSGPEEEPHASAQERSQSVAHNNDDIETSVQEPREERAPDKSKDEDTNVEGPPEDPQQDPANLPNPDYVVMSLLVAIQGLLTMSLAGLETIGTPYMMHLFSMDSETATLYFGLLLLGCSIVSIPIMMAGGPIAKW